ncbi:YSIRK-type signal peptide-containing protein [Staphylococcus agnetis]
MNNEIKHTHSIRKYNIGAASVVLGMIIFFRKYRFR